MTNGIGVLHLPKTTSYSLAGTSDKKGVGIKKADPEKYGLKKNDNVTVYTLPKGKVGKLCSFSYKTPSARAKKLNRKMMLLKGKITAVQNDPEISQQEKFKRVNALKCHLKYLSCKYNKEMDATPTNAVIVDEC